MGGGGKGASQETTVELPEELEQGAVGALGGALQSASLPYNPNRGITIAGFAPQQEAAFQGANQMAGAFGLATGQGSYLPQAETGAGGVRGYSTGALFDQQLNASMSDQDQRRRDDILENYGSIGDYILGGETLRGVPLNGVNSRTPTNFNPFGSGGK